MSYLLDASVLISWLKGWPETVSLLDSLAAGPQAIAVNAVSLAEVYSGVAEKDRAATDRVMNSFEYWPIDRETARLAGSQRYRYARMGTPLGVTDMLMAAQAIGKNATLVTGNVKDFPMPELKLLKVQ